MGGTTVPKIYSKTLDSSAVPLNGRLAVTYHRVLVLER